MKRPLQNSSIYAFSKAKCQALIQLNSRRLLRADGSMPLSADHVNLIGMQQIVTDI